MIDFETYTVQSGVDYIIRKCTVERCVNDKKHFDTDEMHKILEIDFASDTFEAKNMIDFLKKYGKIEYKDSSGIEQQIEIENVLSYKYFGKVVYLKVPREIEEAKDVKFLFTIRDQSYIYKLT